jgi:hypothetical protein
MSHTLRMGMLFATIKPEHRTLLALQLTELGVSRSNVFPTWFRSADQTALARAPTANCEQ